MKPMSPMSCCVCFCFVHSIADCFASFLCVRVRVRVARFVTACQGVSWYGMELPTHCLEGLDSSSMDDILELISQMNFNAIRVPLALDHLKQNPRVSAEQLSIFANPDLKGSTYKKLLEALITKSAARDILILLDLHRLSSSDWPTDGVWYSNSTSEDDVVLFWSTAARLYRSHWNVIGADLYNEPHGTEKWSQWKAFVEKASNEIHSIAPKWTIFAEGVGNSVGQVKEPVFWAENLRPAYTDPPVLRKSRKIVLSPHVYGKSCVLAYERVNPGNCYVSVGRFVASASLAMVLTSDEILM